MTNHQKQTCFKDRMRYGFSSQDHQVWSQDNTPFKDRLTLEASIGPELHITYCIKYIVYFSGYLLPVDRVGCNKRQFITLIIYTNPFKKKYIKELIEATNIKFSHHFIVAIKVH